MNILKTIPAMNKNLFFGVGFVLFTSLLFLLYWLFGLPIKVADKVLIQLPCTEQKVHRLKVVQSTLQLNSEFNDPFAVQTGIKTEDVGDAIRDVRNDIRFYQGLHLVVNHSAISASLSDMNRLLTRYDHALNDYATAILERGNENNGLIARWRKASNGLIKASAADSPEVIALTNRLRELENSYLLTRDIRIPAEILSGIETLQNRIGNKSEGIQPADLTQYNSLTQDVANLDKRMGTGTDQSLANQVTKDLQMLLLATDNATEQLNQLQQNIRSKWNRIRAVVIVFLTLAGILVLILVTNSSLSHPLATLLTYIRRLNKGELPEEPVESSGLPEIQKIEKELNRLTLELRSKAAFAEALNDNNLESQLAMNNASDWLGQQLIELQNKMLTAREKQQHDEAQNTIRRYINEGLAKFADILRNQSNDIQQLGDLFIRELVKYLGAIQGGFFLLNGNDSSQQELELVSAFAYNRKKYMQKSLAVGEGLVGTCAREKQVIHLSEIPQGYITITSGLGDSRPDNLLLVPVLHEDHLLGVLEIASLKRFSEHEIQFAREVSGNLGSTIIYARNNQQTVALLAKSQQQAQEMAEQEEEMRQNMEELKATQEESARREEEFRGIAEAMESSILTLEYDLEGIVLRANEKFCLFTGRLPEELIGKTHQEIVEGSFNPGADFWNDLADNGHHTIFEDIRIGKKNFRLKEHFSVIRNRDGKTVRFINFVTEMDAKGQKTAS